MYLPFIVTIGATLSWAALSVVSRILLLTLNLDPWPFSFVQLCAGGLALLVLSGRQFRNLSSLFRPTTWVLGALRVLSAALHTAVLVWVSVLEAGILGAINIPMTAIALWLIFGRHPARAGWLGHLLILAAITVLVWKLEIDNSRLAVGLMMLNAMCLVAIATLAERHPDNISDQPGVRLRFTGAVLLVTAALFLAVRFVQGGFGDGATDWTLLIVGGAVGVALRAPSMVLSFWSIRLVGAQNYTASISLLPLFGMAFEQAAIAAGLLDVSRFQIGTLLLALGVVIGTLLVLATRLKETRSSIANVS